MVGEIDPNSNADSQRRGRRIPRLPYGRPTFLYKIRGELPVTRASGRAQGLEASDRVSGGQRLDFCQSCKDRQTAIFLHGRMAGAGPGKRSGGLGTHGNAHIPSFLPDVD